MNRRQAADERGQTLVEFGLILPIVLLFMLGLFDLGRIVFINNSLSDAARNGARHASIDPRSGAYCSLVDEAVRSATRGQALTPYTVTITTLDGDGNALATYVVCQNGLNGPGRAAMIADEQVGPGDRVTVGLGANLQLALGFIAQATGQSSFDLEAASTMQVTFAP